ncbi:hypothetical protein Cylst_0083 [Cylindrospermum stagnale PCC 7417]|uniref:Uncharacterized protein n=1 Tax=Cylindrospermum stagnale PCC 7417 TaxID=56107 RepID=K9WQJ5_9NOST|nr:hypothetical protein [Cylindrospermum stagnale]AFZ22463.1 hypothetical protein Cylst_0083 [Cylindrospermum stagnale PCC 7417]
MKLTTLKSTAQLFAFVTLFCGMTRNKVVDNSNTNPSIDTAIKPKTLSSYSPNINYLKPFDTAFLAYHMMGLNKF